MESQTRKKDEHLSPVKGNKEKALSKKKTSAHKTVMKHPKEFGGPKGPEPTRFGDWEQKGRCSDF